MFSGGEVVTLLGLIIGPIGGGFAALFYWAKSQADARVKDAQDTITRQSAEYARREERLTEERDNANKALIQALMAARESAQTTAQAVQLTRMTKEG